MAWAGRASALATGGEAAQGEGQTPVTGAQVGKVVLVDLGTPEQALEMAATVEPVVIAILAQATGAVAGLVAAMEEQARMVLREPTVLLLDTLQSAIRWRSHASEFIGRRFLYL